MSTMEHRPFTAATDKFAFAQAFSRTSLPSSGLRAQHVSLLRRAVRAFAR